ncbi:hypothetical protein OF846_001000 [Rhodotorula toruloides]|nr:hypothetical protein OF846_001000 [Rhodotorula toruloides]
MYRAEAGAPAPKLNPPLAPGVPVLAPNVKGAAPPGPATAPVAVPPAGAPNVNGEADAGAPNEKDGAAVALEADSDWPIPVEVGAPKEKPVDAGEGVAEPKAKGAGVDEAGAAPKAGAEDCAPNAKGEGAAPAVDVLAPKLKDGAVAAGEGGAGEADGEAPKEKEGFAAVDAAPPKRDGEAAGAPNGEAGGASFFSVDGPKLKPVDPVDAPKGEGAELDEAPKLNAGAAGGAGLAAALDSPPSSSIPLSPSASSANAALAGLRPPNRVAGAGVASFFSSACGVAGVVPKVKVGAGAFVSVVDAGVEAEPKEKGDAAGLSAGFEAALPNEKGDDAAAPSVLGGAPNEKPVLAGSTFFCSPSFDSSAAGLPNAANGFATGVAASFASGVGGTTSVGLMTGSDSSFFVTVPNENVGMAGLGAAASAFFSAGVSFSLSARIEAKKLGLPLATGAAGGAVAGAEKEKPEDDGADVADLAKKPEAAGVEAGLSSFFSASSFFAACAPNEKVGKGTAGLSAAEGAEPNENAGLPGSLVEVNAGAPRRLNKLLLDAAGTASSFFSVTGAAGAPNENPAGILKAGIWIFASASSSIGGRSSSFAEKTRDELACCLDVCDLPGRRDERPVEVEGAVAGNEEGAGKVIFGTAGAASTVG